MAKNILKNAYKNFPIGYVAAQPADVNTEKRKHTKFMKVIRVGKNVTYTAKEKIISIK
jgi:hypothetical protein